MITVNKKNRDKKEAYINEIVYLCLGQSAAAFYKTMTK